MPLTVSRSGRARVQAVGLYGILAVITVLFIAPTVWMAIASFKTTAQIAAVPVRWITWPPTFSNYVDAVTEVPLVTYFGNSLFLAVCNVIGVLFSSTLVAY